METHLTGGQSPVSAQFAVAAGSGDTSKVKAGDPRIASVVQESLAPATPQRAPDPLIRKRVNDIFAGKVGEKLKVKFEPGFKSTALKVLRAVGEFFSKIGMAKAGKAIQSFAQEGIDKIATKMERAIDTCLTHFEAAAAKSGVITNVESKLAETAGKFGATSLDKPPTPLRVPAGLADKEAIKELKKLVSEFKHEFKELILPAYNNMVRSEIAESSEKLPNLEGATGSWCAHRVDSGLVIHKAEVSPTSARGSNKEIDGLHNCYVNTVTLPDGKKQFNITTGVINSKEKADAFVVVIKQAVADRQLEKPVRIGMHQLNSFAFNFKTKEGTMIDTEHKMSRYIQDQLREASSELPDLADARVLHENTSFNANSEMPGEHARCNAMNSEAVAQHLQMLVEDGGIRLAPEFKSDLKKTLDAVENAYKDLGKKDVSSGLVTSGREDLLGQIGKLLPTVKTASEQAAAAAAADPGNQELSKASARLIALESRMETVTGKDKDAPSPPASMAMQHILDICSECATQINCKSGLDRTGSARSIIATLDKMISDGVPLHEVANFVKNMDTTLARVNAAYDELGTPPTDRQGQLDFQVEWQVVSKELAQDPSCRLAMEFQKSSLSELMRVGLEVTARSTGAHGVKWHHEGSMGLNPHPGTCLPRFVQDEAGNMQKMVSMVDEKPILTEFGLKLLSMTSSMRGG